MPNDATERGVTDHRVVRSLEELIRGFQARGIGTNQAIRLAGQYVLALEERRWWERRGYDMSKTKVVEDGDE